MEKKDILKKYIDEIRTYRFYELIPNLMYGEVVVDKNSIRIDEMTYAHFMTKGDDLVRSDRGSYRRPVQISLQLLTSDGYILEKDLNWAVEMAVKTYESINKDTKDNKRTDEEIDDDKKLFRKLTEMMSMDLVGVTGNKTPFSEFARIIKEMDDIISKIENK